MEPAISCKKEVARKEIANPPEVPNVKSTFSLSLQHSQELRGIIEVAIV